MAYLSSARRLLESMTVADFVAERPPSAVVCLQASLPVPTALATLHRSGLLAAPLFLYDEHDDELSEGGPSFLGFLSVAGEQRAGPWLQ